MYVVGLTGGIGSGKSTVAGMLEELGATILSADLTGHEVYTPGRPAWQEIVAAFGRNVVAGDGTIDRAKLRNIVFSDPTELARLNSITHPRMKEMMREKIEDLRTQATEVVVLEAALLYDAGWDDLTDEVWTTLAPPEVAAKRAAERSGIPVEQVLDRIQKAQMGDSDRVSRADIVINTVSTLEETRRQVENEWNRLRARLAARPAETSA
jgi:dephospho-CoA kinase